MLFVNLKNDLGSNDERKGLYVLGSDSKLGNLVNGKQYWMKEKYPPMGMDAHPWGWMQGRSLRGILGLRFRYTYSN